MNKSYLYEYFNTRNITSSRMASYQVKDGDSLYKIATSQGVSVEDLMKANNLTNTLIYPNQILIIPKTETVDGIYFEEYKVKVNDTLEKIENEQKVALSEIAKYNDLTKLQLLGNQTLNIPRMVDTYVIKGTDTIKTILDAHDLTPYELIKLNSEKWLIPGTTINVK